MKKGILIIGCIIMIANILLGAIITSYSVFNVCVTSIVIAVTTALLIGIASSKLKDAFKISLNFLFAFFGLIEFVLGIFAPEQYKNNWYLIAIICLIIIESIFLTFGRVNSKH